MTALQRDAVSPHLTPDYIGKLRELQRIAEQAGAGVIAGFVGGGENVPGWIHAGTMPIAEAEIDAALFAASCRCDRERDRMFAAIATVISKELAAARV